MKTIKNRIIVGLFTLAFITLCLPLTAQADPTFVNAASPDLPEKARGVPKGGALRVFGLNLETVGEVSLDLTRFEVFAPDAQIVVASGAGEIPISIPAAAYFRGRIESQPDSVAMFVVPESSPVRGTITGPGGMWLIKSNPAGLGVKTRKVDTATELADRVFNCGVDDMSVTGSNMSQGLGGSDGVEAAALPTNVQYTAHMIIDTDYEYWLQFWNIYGPDVNETGARAMEYIGDLIAYASIPYEREIDTNLLISYARLWADNTDPYVLTTDTAGCGDEGALDEVQDVWSGSGMPRTLVHLLSGKPGGGCAYHGDYEGVLCSTDIGYGASMGIGTGFDIDNPGFLWEGMVIAHEIGHNFGSRHTHSYCGVSGIADPVDICTDNCLGASIDIPGLGSLTGGTAGEQNGTIMSYCHLRTDGHENIAHTFGTFHPYGVAAWRVPVWMRSKINAGCMGLSYEGSDLRVFKDCKPDDPMLVGENAICTISVQNLGPQIALGVIAVDELVSSGVFSFGDIIVTKGANEFTDMCTTTGNPQDLAGTVTCELGDIASGHTAVIEIPITADEAQNINDRVAVTSDSLDPNTSNNMAEDEVNIVEMADLEVFKDCKPDEPMLAGETGICTITVKNWGPSIAEDVALIDQHISNGTFNFGTITETQGTCSMNSGNPQVNDGDVSCELGHMDPGDEVIITVELLSDEGQNINDLAIASSDTYDPDNTNNSASDGVGVEPVADLSITKTEDQNPVTAGTLLTYNLGVTNGGPSTAVNVVISDVLPAGVTIVSVASPDGTCNAGVPGDGLLPTTCTVDSLADGESATMQIVVFVEPQTLGTLGNNAQVSSDLFDPDNSNNLATTVTTVEASADLSVAKSDHPDPVLAGEYLTYEIDVMNNGPSTAVDVTLSDLLPSWVIFDGYIISNGSGTCVPLGGSTNVECDLNDLDPGQFVTVFIKVLVDPATPDGEILVNTATVSSVTPDPNGSNNTSDPPTETTVLAQADLAITKDASFLENNPAPRIVYTLVATNNGPSDALDVTVIDMLPLTPKKIVYIMDSGNGACTYSGENHNVICNFGTLPAGESISVDIVVDAAGSVRRITNVAVVETSTTDPNPDNQTAYKEVKVKGGTDETSPSTKEGKGKTCSDSIDNDGDGAVDCLDSDCSSNKACK